MKYTIFHTYAKFGTFLSMFLLLSKGLVAQTGNLMIQEPNHQAIIVYIEGVQQNHHAQAHVHLTGLTPGNCKLRITCAGSTIVEETVALAANTEVVYEIQKKGNYASPSHFLKRISVINIHPTALDDRGTTSASYNDLARVISSVKEDVFFADGFSIKDAWVSSMQSKARAFKYYDCLAEQIRTIISLKNDVFFADGMNVKAAWAKRMVEKIMGNPVYDCSIPEKMRAVVSSKRNSGGFGPDTQANWARREVEKLLD